MFSSLVKSIVAFNSTTKFERARVQATYYGNSEPPKEEDIKVLLQALSDKDSETKAISGFNEIINKLKTSESRKYWNFIVKNLVLFDRLVEERTLLKEIHESKLPEIENYDAREKRYKEKNIEKLINTYLFFIQAKAKAYLKKSSSLNVPSDSLKQYFKSLNFDEIFSQNNVLETLSFLAFEVFKTGDNGHLKYKINQYVFLMIYSSLLKIFSTQYVAFISIVKRFFDMEIQPARKVHEAFKAFILKTEEFVAFTNKYKYIPGFQISLKELRNPAEDTKLLESMEEYIHLLADEVHENTRAIKKQSLINERPKLQVKRSEIDIKVVIHQLNTNQGHHNRENYSPSPKSGGKDNISPNYTSKYKQNHNDLSTPKKSVSLTFEDTLKLGFHRFVNLEESLGGDILNEYQAKRINEEDEEQEDKEVSGRKKKSLSNEWTLTPAFKKLLFLDEEDKLYEAFKNGFSSEYDETFARVELKTRPRDHYYELKEIGLVLTECQSFVNSCEGNEVTAIDDFKPELFDSFKNLYSKDFKLPFVK